ncbi:hypothetical protein [Pseudofrankia inefficax]|nr:hypothetical protein [Pseudofrankia inefficax]
MPLLPGPRLRGAVLAALATTAGACAGYDSTPTRFELVMLSICIALTAIIAFDAATPKKIMNLTY